MVTARDGGKEEIIKIIRNVVVNATVNGPGRDGLIKSILDLEKSVQHTLMLIIQVENSDDAERMRRLLDEVDVLWSHVAEADAVGDYVVTLEKISCFVLNDQMLQHETVAKKKL
ncbi:hypothetical protein T01_4114 [Trichinella spiralis]|uniref:Uncharacterized protein n=1 Tax=Trichinella spiralis TaxID=6334 RepID=A0A0V1ATF9_TRISP|nr:hypothetical protein T01_4114 [Trichinella spiralis]